MTRLLRFCLTMLTWLSLIFYLATWVDGNALGYSPGISDVLFAALPGIVLVLALNTLIWFGEGIWAGLQDTYYEDERHRRDNQQSRQSSIEKRKRDRLDAVLRDLSDDELHRLRQRLSDGTVDDDDLYARMTIGDDGELMRRD